MLGFHFALSIVDYACIYLEMNGYKHMLLCR